MATLNNIAADPILQAQRGAKKVLEKLFAHARNWPAATGLPSFDARPTDVIVTTFPKAGTTLMQQMVYQVVVASGGASAQDVDGTQFDDITSVVPWVDFCQLFCKTPSETTPRVFKTHAAVDAFRAAGKMTHKHLVIIRKPSEYPSSFLDFVVDSLAPGVIKSDMVHEELFHAFVREVFLSLPSKHPDLNSAPDGVVPILTPGDTVHNTWFSHTRSWVDMLSPRVLILFYDDIISDYTATARTIARFLRVKLDSRGAQTVAKRSSRRAMLGNAQFGAGCDGKGLGLAPKESKVKPVRTTGFKKYTMKAEHVDEMHRQMHETFGVSSYEELKLKIKGKQQHLHGDILR